MALREVSPLSFVWFTLDTKLIIYISPKGQGIVARARPAVPLGLWSITSSLRGNLYVPRLHKFIKWFADNDVAHRN